MLLRYTLIENGVFFQQPNSPGFSFVWVIYRAHCNQKFAFRIQTYPHRINDMRDSA